MGEYVGWKLGFTVVKRIFRRGLVELHGLFGEDVFIYNVMEVNFTTLWEIQLRNS